jgi:glycosyltransferase involved in cell wall biosynthesis
LKTVQPDVVWVIPVGWSIPPLADVLLDSKIGFHVSIYDYPDIGSWIGRLGINRCRRMATQVDELFVRATTRDTISQQMTDDMRMRTGVSGTVNSAGLEKEDFDYLSKEPKTHNESIRIAYAGTIIAEEAFATFVKALAKIRSRLPLPLKLDLFGDHSYRSRHWFDASWIIEHGSLTARELLQAIKECTWGFSPMELTDDNARYNRFSLPTKIVSYLAAGLPVISLGHPESTIVKLASKYQVGICLTENNPDSLSARLSSGLSAPNPRTAFRPEILRCAREEFDARRIRNTLYENFQKCASVSK